jgi:hypothetical protein
MIENLSRLLRGRSPSLKLASGPATARGSGGKGGFQRLVGITARGQTRRSRSAAPRPRDRNAEASERPTEDMSEISSRQNPIPPRGLASNPTILVGQLPGLVPSSIANRSRAAPSPDLKLPSFPMPLVDATLPERRDQSQPAPISREYAVTRQTSERSIVRQSTAAAPTPSQTATPKLSAPSVVSNLTQRRWQATRPVGSNRMPSSVSPMTVTYAPISHNGAEPPTSGDGGVVRTSGGTEAATSPTLGGAFADDRSGPPPNASQDRRTQIGTVHLDGNALGQWVTRHLERVMSEPNRGPSGVDPRTVPYWGPASAAY